MGTLTAAADGSHTQGAMIALMPTAEDAQRLAIDGGEEVDQLHLTLYYLGKGADFDDTARAALISTMTEATEDYVRGPITARIFGAAHWNGNSDEPSWVWSVGDERHESEDTPRLTDAHEAAAFAISMAIRNHDLDPDLVAEQHSPWVPHVCAAYSDQLDLIIALEERLGPVTFDRVRVAFAGEYTDIPLSGAVTAAADGPLRRQPTEVEVQSRVSFADMDEAWRDAVTGAVDAWSRVQKAQRAEIVSAVRAAVDADNLDQLNAVTVDTQPAANLLYGRMQAFAQAAGEAQQREAEEQGVTVPGWSLDDEALTAAAWRDRLRQIAATAARLLGVGMVQSAVRRAVQLFGSGTADDVAAQVDEHLRGLSTASVEEQVGAAMTAAQNAGRMAVLAAAPAGRHFASEALDRNSCAPCREVDGAQYDSLTAAMAAYPNGGFVGCLGGPRCRGTLVTVWGGTTAAGTIMPGGGATMRAQADEQGGGAVPYSIVQDHADCAADMPWGVTKDDTGELMGCHATEADAQQQQAALYAAEDDDMPDDEDDGMDMGGQTAPWEGVLAVEGIVTGDGREFAPEALKWADLPIPLRWNKEDSHGGEPHTVAVNVGRIDKIWRDSNKIMGAGVLNLAEPDGQRVHDMIKGEFIRGVSIDADSIADADVEFVWPDDVNNGTDEDTESDLFEMLFAQPEKVIFHGGRIRAATLVDIPAFAEAYVALLDDTGTVVAGGTPVGDLAQRPTIVAGAVGTHSTATSEGTWDGPANERSLPSPLTVEQARDAYAWYDSARVSDGTLPKNAAKFLHHNIGADGSIGAANLAACSATIGALHGARGTMPNIPESQRRGVYDHVAKHLRDAGQEPEPFRLLPKAQTAGASGPWRPPAAWFADPQLSVPTGITITDDGRLYGHAAQWGTCHIGQEGVCVQPPREDAHPYYMTGELTCDDGSTVAVGQITVGTGHAPLHLGAGPAAEHYDDTGAAVADVAVGNDRHGIWVAGAVRPGADPDRVHELRAAGQVSGDWRRIGGSLRLVGLLAVNVPGFPVPRMRARVASGRQEALVAAGRPTVAHGLSAEEEQARALRVVMGMLRDRVHKGGD